MTLLKQLTFGQFELAITAQSEYYLFSSADVHPAR